MKYCPESKRAKLLDVCRTRWCARVDGMSLFVDLFVPIILTLEEMTTSSRANNETSKQARSFYKLLHDFHFIVTLVVTNEVLSRTLPATNLLQTKNADILKNLNVVTSLKETARSLYVDAEGNHSVWYSIALRLAEKVNAQESKRRTCNKQVHRANPIYSSVSDYYFKTLTTELLAHLSTQLERRFDDGLVAYQGLSIVPSIVVPSCYGGSEVKNWRECFKKFVSLYEEDFPNLSVLEGELDSWEGFWLSYEHGLPNTVLGTIKKVSSMAHVYPNIWVALQILATLPITSCECERCFSAMRKLKNCYRSNMQQDRFNGLSLMYIHPEIVPEIDKVIDTFAELGPRRLEFL